MSWFDKLFGEDNDSNDRLIHRKKDVKNHKI